MIGAGLFVAFGPAAAAAQGGLFAALGLAGLIAVTNAISSSRLAARHPQSGGTYVYATEQLHPAAGHVAGWAFLLGKTASCAAMAYAIGVYAAPEHARWVGTGTLITLTALALWGVQRSTAVMVIVGSVVVVGIVTASFLITAAEPAAPQLSGGTPRGVLEGAALLFFAFAGYARLSTMGEEIRDPAVTIPRAVSASVAVVAGLYIFAAYGLSHSLGADLASSAAPWSDALRAAGHRDLVPAVSALAMAAAAGALLSLCLGVSRTAFAMARDGHLPNALVRVTHRSVPWVAELGVVAVALTALWTLDLPTTIGFSSCCVLIYYAFANASAFTLGTVGGRTVAIVGLAGCVLLAFSVPMGVWLATLGLLAAVAATRSGQQRNEPQHQADHTEDERDR